MSFHQLDPTLPVHVMDKGDGYAFAVIDYGQEHNLIWVTAITATGEIWCAPNPKVRVASNWTMGRIRRAPAPAPANETTAASEEEDVSPRLTNGAAPRR